MGVAASTPVRKKILYCLGLTLIPDVVFATWFFWLRRGSRPRRAINYLRMFLGRSTI